MITTIDGVEKDDGGFVYIYTYREDGYAPLLLQYNSKDKTDRNYFHDVKLCAEQCRLMNQDNKI